MKKAFAGVLVTALVALLISCGDGSDSGLRSVSAADIDPAALEDFELGDVPVLEGEVGEALEASLLLLFDALDIAFEDNVEMQQAFALALNTVSVAGTASSVGTAAIEFDVTEGDDFLSARVRISDEVWSPIDGFVGDSTVEIPNLRLDARVDFRQTRIDGSLDTKGTIKVSQIKEADCVEGDYWITDGVINFDAVGRFSFSEGPNQSLRFSFEYKAALKSGMSVSGPIGGKFMVTVLSSAKSVFDIDPEAEDFDPSEILESIRVTVHIAVYDNENELAYSKSYDLAELMELTDPFDDDA